MSDNFKAERRFMNEKTIATISLRERYADLQEVLRDAAAWVEIAAAQGADLAVLPETINLLHTEDNAATLADLSLDDWQTSTAMLCDAAANANISLVLPLLVRDGGALANRFYLLARDGSEIGFYQKRAPAVGEREAGVESRSTSPLRWEGLTVGGGICIDVYFPHQIFESQMENKPDLFVIPSMTPGGTLLDYSALTCGVPFVLAYSPWNRILDRDGREIAAGGYRFETLRAGFGSAVQQATLNFDSVTLFADFNQDKMRDVQRHYRDKVRVRFDQSNCVFFLESRSLDLTIAEVMSEFGLVSRRDYLSELAPATGQ